MDVTQTLETVPGYTSARYSIDADERGYFWLVFEQDENPYSATYGKWLEHWEGGPYATPAEALAGVIEYADTSPYHNP